MTETEIQGRAQDMAKRMAMSYLSCSVSDCYLSESVDILNELGLYKREVKRRITSARDYFSKYNQCVKWIFDYCGGDVKALLCDDYDVLKEACDNFMGAKVRMSAYHYNNNDNLREEGEYLCRISGAKHVDKLVLHWEQRQWSCYSLSAVADGWVPLKAGVHVVEVLERVYNNDKQHEPVG